MRHKTEFSVFSFPLGPTFDAGQLNSLKEENDSLKCQLEAYVNETEMTKLDRKKEEEEHEKNIKTLQNALQGMQQVSQFRLTFTKIHL